MKFYMAWDISSTRVIGGLIMWGDMNATTNRIEKNETLKCVCHRKEIKELNQSYRSCKMPQWSLYILLFLKYKALLIVYSFLSIWRITNRENYVKFQDVAPQFQIYWYFDEILHGLSNFVYQSNWWLDYRDHMNAATNRMEKNETLKFACHGK